MRFSLKQLFLGVTFWSICIAAMVAELSDWMYAIAIVAALAATLSLFVKCDSTLVAGFLSLPLICLANWSSFFIALGYVFGEKGIVVHVVGPIASRVSWPVVVAKNSVSLEHAWWQLMFGVAVVSFVEALALLLAMALLRRYAKRKHAPLLSFLLAGVFAAF